MDYQVGDIVQLKKKHPCRKEYKKFKKGLKSF